MLTPLPDFLEKYPISPVRLDEDNGKKDWNACLKLRYTAKFGKTGLSDQHHTGPLLVQKPFYPEGPQVCHTYVIHPPGGVVGGDKLDLNITVEQGGHGVITTPAAGKFYRSAGPGAAQINRLNISAGANLEWLPQETIIYNQANAKILTIVQLEQGARFIGWEMICLGLPASRQLFTQGWLAQQFDVLQGKHPLFIETFQIQGKDPILTARWGLAGRPVIGTMVSTVDDPELVQMVRAQTTAMNLDGLFAVTRINGLTICRFLGNDVYTGFKFFLRVWEILRPAVFKRQVCVPRIWAT